MKLSQRARRLLPLLTMSAAFSFSLLIPSGTAVRAVLSRAVHKRTAYTIVWQVTDYDANGKPTPVYTETRYVASNGNWRSTRYYTDGKREELFAEVGRGVFAAKSNKLHFLSGHNPSMAELTLEGFQKAPGYVRSENVMGLLTVVQRPANDPEGSRMEGYRALSLNGDFIKIIFYGATTTVQEPVSLVLGEPDPALLKIPSDLPVDTKNYEQLHGSRAKPN